MKFPEPPRSERDLKVVKFLEKFPELPWSERDLKVVEFLENERLIKEYSIELARCTNEEDILCPISGALRKRGAKYYAQTIEVLRFRNQILREELDN